MAASTNQATTTPTSMMIVVNYFVFLVVNAIVLYVANLFFPSMVVLGTMNITAIWAIVFSMGALALLNILALPFVHLAEERRGKVFSPRDWMIAYFFVNMIGVWLIARFSQQFGLGISGWYVAAGLALALDFAQGGAMMQLEKYRQSKLS